MESRPRAPSATGILLGQHDVSTELPLHSCFWSATTAGFIAGQTIHANGGTGYY